MKNGDRIGICFLAIALIVCLNPTGVKAAVVMVVLVISWFGFVFAMDTKADREKEE